MKAALVVHTVTTSREKNMATVLKMVEEAAEGGATVVLFAEAALTGLTNNDDPAHDLPLGEPIPGAATQCLCAVAAERRICVAIGLLEREGGKLYDAAILVDANGTIQLKYRRIQPQWHGHRADTNVYCHGSEVPKAETAFGSVSFLICGDLF